MSTGRLASFQPDNPEHQRRAAPLVQAEALLRAAPAAGAALDFDAVVAKAAQLVEAQMRESLAAEAVEELGQLGDIVAEYRPQDVAAFNSAYARVREAKDMAARMAAELAASAPTAAVEVAPATPEMLAIRREMAERATLAPSLVQQYMARVYNRYPEPDSGSAYAHYLQPLRDARAKRMLHALLIYSGANPELMRALSYEQAREHIVQAANRLSAEHDPEDAAGLSVAVAAYAAELGSYRSRLVPAEPRNVPAPPAEAPPAPGRRSSVPDLSAGLDYFPGWPEITEQYGDMLRSGLMKLVKDEQRTQRPHDEQPYDIYIGGELVGRFTVRRYADHVERNVLFTHGGRMTTYGRSDDIVDDHIRQIRQKATRFLDRVRRRS